LEIRVGINTGSAVVGDLGSARRKEYTAIGTPVNIASRLQQYVAGPNQVIIGPATHSTVSESFVCTALAPCQVPGLREPLNAYRVESDRER
jgi:adenylate cyclase